MENKEKLAFIPLKWHTTRSKSMDFLYEYLNEYYNVEIIGDSGRGDDVDWDYITKNFDKIVIFQPFLREKYAKKLKNKSVVFCPMYDSVLNKNFLHWYNLRHFKILNFCEALHKKLLKMGFDSYYFKYYLEPSEKFTPSKTDEVFFWQRRTQISWKQLRILFKNLNLQIHIHKSLDPNAKFFQPSKNEEEKYNITYSEWFEKKEDYENLVKNKGIFVAPRLAEGFGTSILEAISEGKVIIAHNAPAMNEYIENGVTGYLVDFKNPKPLKFENLEQIQHKTYETGKKGHEQWLKDRSLILELLNKPESNPHFSFWQKLLVAITKHKF